MREKIFTVLAGIAAAVLLASGCRQVNVAEALQQPKGSGIYTQCNLWYNSDEVISSMNYQDGKVIPFGTPVEIIKARETAIYFKTLGDNQEYKIDFDPEWAMIPVETYIRQVFTVQDRQQLSKDIEPDLLKSIERGIVVKGMTRKEVLLTCGTPAACRTPSLENDTWVFWVDRFSTIRVVFKDGKVAEILSLK